VKKPLQPTKPIVDHDREPYLIGCARESMADQSPQLQVDALKAHGVPGDRIYFDRKSGSGAEREQFEMMLKDTREGDVIVVWMLDRLGRNVRQVLDTFAELDRKGAKVRVLTQPGMDTTTAMGRQIVTIMAAVAEMERDLTGDRWPARNHPKGRSGWTLERNEGALVHYAARRRSGEPISTAFVESCGQRDRGQAYEQEAADALEQNACLRWSATDRDRV
jgi:DNA invertase Pin-like site-specific DNA recombinase